ARAALALSTYDILLLDLGLPDGDGLELITEITSRPNLHLPIIVITARDALSSRLDGLNAGADDYLVKPFDLLELHARIQAILRRPSERQSGILACGDVTFDMGERDDFVGGRARRLPRREAAMMEELLRAAGRTVIRDVLEERLYAFNEPVTPNAIEAVVSRLRKKMELLGSTIRIETKRGIGYRISDDPGVTP
ncbi:MAG: response regulator transcription factor, partial [Sphingomonadales bacterium]|nr:response regulator transcription factor [Sphingomonadales bacterium]